jgi:glyoxylase-like metal-dependent hydrolase (beta-lactamase superfamily II)
VIQEWGAPLTDLFPRTVYTDEMKLPNAIKATGNDIKDVKAIIMGHLHLDHAGGLEHFIGTNVPGKLRLPLRLDSFETLRLTLPAAIVYVHEEEFKHATWSVATKTDSGVYLASYLSLTALNWQTFSMSPFELCQGITLHHSPGHTPGLCLMQINLPRDGTFVFTTDQYHIRENYEDAAPQGWLMRDQSAWLHSHQMVQKLVRLFGARLVFGHDLEVVQALLAEKKVLE